MLISGFIEVERLEFAAFKPDASSLLVGIDRNDLSASTILAGLVSVVSGELGAVALHQFHAAGSERLTFGCAPLAWSPVNGLAVRFFE